MILRRLTEAPDRGSDEPISVVSRRPSEVTYENFPDKTKELIANNDWVGAYRTLVNTSDIELFIEYFIYNYWLFRNITKNIEPIYKSLSRALLSMGDRAFSLDTNPLLAFIKSYFSLGNSLTNDQFQMVVDWWNSGTIADKDLRADKIENSILLNQNLYSMGNNTFIVQAYYWLAIQKNVMWYIDLEKSSPEVLKPQLMYVLGVSEDTGLDIAHITVKKFRDMVIFVNGESQDGPIHQATEIQAMMSRLQHVPQKFSGREDSDDDAASTVSVKPTKWDDNQIDNIMKNGKGQLNADTANILANYMHDKGLI